MVPIDNAIAAIKLQQSGEKFTYQAIANQFGVSRTTLLQRHQACQRSQNTKNNLQKKLNPHQESELVKYIESLAKRALPPTRDMIQNFASQITAALMSAQWVARFIN
jgi:hypothetical protein